MQKSRLEVGVDVPWVTSWTEEPIIGVRRCPTVGGSPALVQVQRAGHGRPQYSKNHLVRQRQSVLRMLCPMCGRPTHPGDRWTQLARERPAGFLRGDGRAPGLSMEIENERIVVDSGSIAPLHQTCVARSLEHCPHLRGHPGVDVRPFPARWTLLPLLIEASPMVEAGSAQAAVAGAAIMVVTFLQLLGITDRIDRKWRRRLAAKAHPSRR